MKSFKSLTIQKKTTEQYFPVILLQFFLFQSKKDKQRFQFPSSTLKGINGLQLS